MQAIDLHVHSTFSDGTLTPTQLVSLALKSNLEAFALTDHDTTEGIDEALSAAKDVNLEVIPGIEFSTEYRGKDIHILGYYINPDNENFISKVQEFRDSRENRNKKMCAKLNELGIDIDYDSFVKDYPDSVITRAHYAKYMVAHGYIKYMDEAFEKYIGDDCPGFIPREKITPTQAVSLIISCGGIPVLAHPILYKLSDSDLEELVASLKKSGLKGIETIYSTNSQTDERLIRKLASKYKLLITGGSDFHGNNKPNLMLGCGRGDLFIPTKLLPPLKKAYLNGFVTNPFIKNALFFDLDGSLLSDEKEISPITKALLFQSVEKGHLFVINTGRPLESALRLVKKLGIEDITDYIAAFNGGVVYNCKTQTIEDRTCLDADILQTVRNIAKELGIHFHTYSDFEVLSEKDTEEFKYYTNYVNLPGKLVDDVTISSPTPYKILLMNFEDRNKLFEARKRFEDALGDRITVMFSNDKFLEIIPRESGKGSSLRKICNLAGIKVQNSYAFADEENDISLCEAAGKSVCLINGNPKLKAVSSYITFRDNNHDGLADFLEFFAEPR